MHNIIIDLYNSFKDDHEKLLVIIISIKLVLDKSINKSYFIELLQIKN